MEGHMFLILVLWKLSQEFVVNLYYVSEPPNK